MRDKAKYDIACELLKESGFAYKLIDFTDVQERAEEIHGLVLTDDEADRVMEDVLKHLDEPVDHALDMELEDLPGGENCELD